MINESFPYNRLQEAQLKRSMRLYRAVAIMGALLLGSMFIQSVFASDYGLIDTNMNVATTTYSIYGGYRGAGTNDKLITRGQVLDINTGGFTIEALAYYYGSPGGDNYLFDMPGHHNAVWLYVNGTRHVCFGYMVNTNGFICSSAQIPTGGTESHIAATYDGVGTTKIYINGVLDASGSMLPQNIAQDYFCSMNLCAGGLPSDLALDELKISKVPLTASQILADYNAGSSNRINMSNDIATWLIYGLNGDTIGSLEKTEPENLASHLTVTSSPPNIVGNPITFNVSWDSLGFDVFTEEFFFNQGSTKHNNLGSNFNVGDTGEFSFPETYTTSGSSLPFVLLGGVGCTGVSGTGALTGSGCIYTAVHGSVSVSSSDQDRNYSFFLHPNSPSHAKGVLDHWSYKIDSGLCPVLDSSLSSATLYHGYTGALGLADTGVTLNSLMGSGSLTFNYTSKELGYDPHPHVKIVCSDGTFSNIYYEDTLYANKSSGYYIQETSIFDNFNTPADYIGVAYLNGGKSSDYNSDTGSGAIFSSDKVEYLKNEPVKTSFYYKTSFTPASVAFYSDYLYPAEKVLSGTYIVNAESHNYTFYYNTTGKHYPVIQVRSASFSGNPACATTCNSNPSTTYRNIFLGGGQIRDVNTYINISNSSLFTGVNEYINNTIYGNTGSQLFSFSANDGIFGLDPATFKVNFGTTNNQLLTWAEDLVNIIIKGMLYISGLAWKIIKNSPIFSFMDGTFHPVSGSIKHFPTKLFGYTLVYGVSSPTFTISYANPANSTFIIVIVNLFIIVEILFMCLKSLFPR